MLSVWTLFSVFGHVLGMSGIVFWVSGGVWTWVPGLVLGVS